MVLVTGDPASMRAAATMLRFNAETLTGIAATVDGHVAGMQYEGPAAATFRAATTAGGNSLRTVSARMVGTAETLLRQAALVEEQLLLQARDGSW